MYQFSNMAVNLQKVNYSNFPPFYFRELGDDVLLTNDAGEWLFLTKKEFEQFLYGDFKKNKELHLKLKENNFLKKELDIGQLSEKYYSRNETVFWGPALHIVIPTLRCDHKCIYCHASAQDSSKKEFDMTQETAKKVVDRIFEAPNKFIVIEFQGGEPLLNWPIVKLIIEYSEKKTKTEKKALEIKLVSNFSVMDSAKFHYLLKKKVALCTSLDGPEKLHNNQRRLLGGNSYQAAAKWLKRFYNLYPKLLKSGYIYRMGGIVTVTKFSLPHYKEIVDEYIKFKFAEPYIRPLNPFGFSRDNWERLKYSPDDYLKFYKNLLSYIIELNFSGKKFREKFALTILRKILTDEDPGHMEYRSPCGAVVGQVAYNFNGDIYTCDEGRMLGMMGDQTFKLGNVFEDTYQNIIEKSLTKIMCLASCLEGLPGCSECAYKPYCGVCPIYNYFQTGNPFTCVANNKRCKINQGIIDFLFENLKNEKTKELFEGWMEEPFNIPVNL